MDHFFPHLPEVQCSLTSEMEAGVGYIEIACSRLSLHSLCNCNRDEDDSNSISLLEK